ncbi:MAG: ATP-binding protein [Pseudomonadota bacterium]
MAPALHIPPEHLRAILDALPDGIGVEREGEIAWANKGFARLYGFADPAEVLGRTLESFVAPEDLSRLLDYSARRLAGEPVPDHYQFQGLRRDGQRVDLEIFVASYIHDGAVHILGALRDITERVALARRMEQAQKLEALGTLTRGIAHDFNNLLTAVIGNLSIAQEQLARGEDPLPMLRRATTAAEKGAQLTRQLQAFSGRRAADDEVADPAGLVNDTVELLQHSISPGVRVEVVVEPDLPAAAISSDQLQQVLMNLALNAVDAMPGGGSLVLRVALTAHQPPERGPGPFLRFEVEDTGHGIPSSSLPRIFEPFFTTKPAGKGTGLGLAVVFGAVRNHGGWVEVDSEPGRGTRFSVYLPVRPRPASRHTPGAVQPCPPRRVLVVDDDVQVRDVIVDILDLHGHTVFAAGGGAGAVSLVEDLLRRGERLDLALVDLVMPDMDGLDCIAALRERLPGLPAVVCTGIDREGRLEGLAPEDGIRVLHKPMAVQDLLAAVGER